MSDKLKLVLAQQNYTLGDIETNADKIIHAAQQARDQHQADVVIFPELAITGYPPEDLLFRLELHQRVQAALQRIITTVADIYIILGYPHFDENNDQCFNSAAVCFGGIVLQRYDKRCLPNYAVFDEKRYFTAGERALVTTIKGCKLGILICEDIWLPGPVRDSAAAGAEMLIALNASPYRRGKHIERVANIHARQVSEAKLPLIYVNLVGGQDELVFDGQSMVIDAQGQVTHQTLPFVEHSLCVSAQRSAQGWQFDTPQRLHREDDIAMVYQALVTGTRDYCHKNGFPGALIGLSGGIDSALTAAIAVDALGAENVKAVSMPSQYTADISKTDAQRQAELLGFTFSEIPIEPMVQAFNTSLHDEFAGRATDVTEENIQSRTRGVLLMAMSNKFGHIVLTTGNKSEMAVGYATLYGDMVGGFAVLKDVPKTLVYELAQYRNQQGAAIPQRVIDREPSAELRPDQVDTDSLPAYAILDPIIQGYVEENQGIEDIIAAGFDEDAVRKAVKLIDRNEYKRRQAPPGVRISKRAFGRDWRYPITSAFGRSR